MQRSNTTCQKLGSAQKKLRHLLYSPPQTAGYVQQLVYVVSDILEEANPALPEQKQALLKAREGIERSLVLANKFDEFYLKGVPLYTMADILQPALQAVQQFLVICTNEE